MYYFSCPSCSHNTRFYRVRRSTGSGNTALLLVTFSGLLSTLLFLDFDRRTRVQCAHCGLIFVRPSMGKSQAALTALALLLCIPAACCFGVMVELLPDTFAGLRQSSVLLWLAGIVEQYSMVVAAAALAAVVLLLVVAGVAACIGNWHLHRRIKSEYKYAPEGFAPAPEPEPTPKQRPANCEKCGYDLTGNVSGVCPECGEKIV